jgi:hypothetical protein
MVLRIVWVYAFARVRTLWCYGRGCGQILRGLWRNAPGTRLGCLRPVIDPGTGSRPVALGRAGKS